VFRKTTKSQLKCEFCLGRKHIHFSITCSTTYIQCNSKVYIVATQTMRRLGGRGVRFQIHVTCNILYMMYIIRVGKILFININYYGYNLYFALSGLLNRWRLLHFRRLPGGDKKVIQSEMASDDDRPCAQKGGNIGAVTRKSCLWNGGSLSAAKNSWKENYFQQVTKGGGWLSLLQRQKQNKK
jgi:hypothetical protein